MRKNKLIRGAVLIAAGIVLQSLRLILPLPPLGSMLIIGSLVNMSLVLTARFAGLTSALLLALLLPVFAYLQGQLLLLFLLPPVALGNAVAAYLSVKLTDKPLFLLAPVSKTLILYGGCYFILRFLAVPVQLAPAILLMMSWPQAITCALGIFLACQVQKKIDIPN